MAVATENRSACELIQWESSYHGISSISARHLVEPRLDQLIADAKSNKSKTAIIIVDDCLIHLKFNKPRIQGCNPHRLTVFRLGKEYQYGDGTATVADFTLQELLQAETPTELFADELATPV